MFDYEAKTYDEEYEEMSIRMLAWSVFKYGGEWSDKFKSLNVLEIVAGMKVDGFLEIDVEEAKNIASGVSTSEWVSV